MCFSELFVCMLVNLGYVNILLYTVLLIVYCRLLCNSFVFSLLCRANIGIFLQTDLFAVKMSCKTVLHITVPV